MVSELKLRKFAKQLRAVADYCEKTVCHRPEQAFPEISDHAERITNDFETGRIDEPLPEWFEKLEIAVMTLLMSRVEQGRSMTKYFGERSEIAVRQYLYQRGVTRRKKRQSSNKTGALA